MTQQQQRRKRWLPKVSRDTVLFVVGMLGVFNEAVLRKSGERPTLILLYAAMMGLPAFLRADEARKKD